MKNRKQGKKQSKKQNEKKLIDLASMTRQELEDYAQNLSTEMTELKQKLDWYEEQFRLGRRKKFGASSEKVDSRQLSLFNEAEAESDETLPEPELSDVQPRTGATKAAKQKKKKQKGHKKQLTNSLPK